MFVIAVSALADFSAEDFNCLLLENQLCKIYNILQSSSSNIDIVLCISYTCWYSKTRRELTISYSYKYCIKYNLFLLHVKVGTEQKDGLATIKSPEVPVLAATQSCNHSNRVPTLLF